MRLLTILTLALMLSGSVWAGDVPRPAAPLTLKTFDGQQVSLDDLKGKVVAVMFFSTTCPHCQQTTQLLNPIYSQWKSRGLEILGFAMNPEATAGLPAFKQKYNVQFPLGLVTKSEFTRFAEISVMARFYVPYMMFVDRNGVIREEHPGGDKPFYDNQDANLKASLDRLLSEPIGKKSTSARPAAKTVASK